MAEETEDSILENALAPKRVSGDTGSVEQHPIADQILADQYKKAQRAASRGVGLKYFKVIPPGAD